MSLALDDFEVGFSLLSQIRELPPVDAIKVDRSFTAGLGQNQSDGAVVRAVLSLAGALGLMAIAEGVETEDQLDRLRQMGCNVGQGFFLSLPHPPGELEPFLALDGRRCGWVSAVLSTPQAADAAEAGDGGGAALIADWLFIACGLSWGAGLISSRPPSDMCMSHACTHCASRCWRRFSSGGDSSSAGAAPAGCCSQALP